MAEKFYGDRPRSLAAEAEARAAAIDDKYVSDYMLNMAGNSPYDNPYPVAPRQQTQIEQRSAEDVLVGVPEAAATMGTSMLADVPAGWAGMMTAGEESGDRQIQPTEAIETVQENLTYMPRSDAGKRVLQMLGGAAESVMDFLRPVGDAYEGGANSVDPSGNLGGIPYAAGAAIIEALPIGKSKKAATAARRSAEAAESGIDADLLAIADKYDPNIQRAAQDLEAGVPMRDADPSLTQRGQQQPPPTDADVEAMMGQPVGAGRRSSDAAANDAETVYAEIEAEYDELVQNRADGREGDYDGERINTLRNRMEELEPQLGQPQMRKAETTTIQVKPFSEHRQNSLNGRGGKTGDVKLMINPDQATLERYAGREGAQIRYSVDKKTGDLYAWDAEVLHDQVLPELRRLGVEKIDRYGDAPVDAAELGDWFEHWADDGRFQGKDANTIPGVLRDRVEAGTPKADAPGKPVKGPPSQVRRDLSHEAIMAREDARPKELSAYAQAFIDRQRQPMGQTAAGKKERGSFDGTDGAAGQVAKTQAARGTVTAVADDKIQARDYSVQKPSKRAEDNFNQKASEARQAMGDKDALQVDAELPKDFDGKTYLTDDGASGFAVSSDGYVSNLFKHPDAPPGAMGAALTKARAAGASNLDAFDTYLAEGYIKRGAVETGRSPWNPEHAPAGWTPEMGEPDYVSMDIGGVIPTQKHSAILGPREQNALNRQPTPRGEPPVVADAFKGGKTNRLNKLVDAGVEAGGEKWYYMAGMLDSFIVELGPELGLKRFDEFMDLNAAVSPRSAVAQQIKRASVLYQRNRKGESIMDLSADMFPPGYGHLATTTAHRPAVNRIVETGSVGDSVKQPKITAYAENMKGNYEPVTVDSHNNQIITGRSASPGGAQYPHLENRQSKLAAKKDLSPAEWQSALWVGGGDITGVKDVRNLPDAMNQRIAATAEHLGIPEQEALVRFMHGDTKLYSVMGAMFLGGAAASQGGGEGNSLNDNAT